MATVKLKKVKFDGHDWILLTDNGGFFNPNSEVYFFSEHQGKIRKFMKDSFGDVEIDKVYEIAVNEIYTQVCGPQCGPYWPKASCRYCGGKGVSAVWWDHNPGFQMGGTDEGNQEIENIKKGKSNIHPELNGNS